MLGGDWEPLACTEAKRGKNVKEEIYLSSLLSKVRNCRRGNFPRAGLKTFSQKTVVIKEPHTAKDLRSPARRPLG